MILCFVAFGPGPKLGIKPIDIWCDHIFDPTATKDARNDTLITARIDDSMPQSLCVTFQPKFPEVRHGRSGFLSDGLQKTIPCDIVEERTTFGTFDLISDGSMRYHQVQEAYLVACERAGEDLSGWQQPMSCRQQLAT